jgi:hypothetical protein
MQQFLQLQNEPDGELDVDDSGNARKSPLWGFRHYLGRLAHHVRAAQELIEDAQYLGSSLLSQFSVKQVDPLPSVDAPVADNLTTLEGILQRMVNRKQNPERFQALFEAMQILNHRFKILERIVKWYEDRYALQVHCEIHILEHFHRNGLQCFHDDRYIGCSKPTCFCCQLYIQYHPARCVEPESHQKIYPKWGVPMLEEGAADPGYVQQRDILIKMGAEIRKQAEDQISSMAGPRPWHPDSLTGITSSIMNMHVTESRLPVCEVAAAGTDDSTE